MIRAQVYTSSDYYQHYIPLFAHCFRKLYPHIGVTALVNGTADYLTLKAGSMVEGLTIVQDVDITFPQTPFAPAINRFLNMGDETEGVDLFIPDVDIMFMVPGVVEYAEQQMLTNRTNYYAAHGCWKLPQRFPNKRWEGDLERLCGAFVYLSSDWVKATQRIRDKFRTALWDGNIGTYREEDEVIFCSICKQAGLFINNSKFYPVDYRGVHLGDFKESMKHRYTNDDKMAKKLTDKVCQAYLEMEATDMLWRRIKEIVSIDPKIEAVFGNLNDHLARRVL